MHLPVEKGNTPKWDLLTEAQASCSIVPAFRQLRPQALYSNPDSVLIRHGLIDKDYMRSYNTDLTTNPPRYGEISWTRKHGMRLSVGVERCRTAQGICENRELMACKRSNSRWTDHLWRAESWSLQIVNGNGRWLILLNSAIKTSCPFEVDAIG